MSLFLDERPVRDAERRNAKFSFQLKDYITKEMPEAEIGSIGNSDSYVPRTSAKTHLDFHTSNSDFVKMNERSDNMKRIPPAKYLTDEPQTYVPPHSDFEDEYRPLPSPTRSSMRSPNPSSRPKEGHRVSFVDSTISELFPKKEDLARRLESEDDLACAGKTAPDKPASAFSFKNTYLTSTPLRKESADGERRRADSDVFNDIGQSAESRDRLKEESSRDRLLRLSSDLYVTTHLTDPLPSSNSLSALRKGFTDVSKTYTLPSKPTMASAHLSTGKSLSRPEFTRDYKNSWSPERPASIKFNSLSVPQNGVKRASSLNSLLSPKSDYLSSGKELDSRDGSASSEVPSVRDVLRQLMDLVDQHWNGSGSLLQNQRFLVPARDLLSHMMSAKQPSQLHSAIGRGQEEDGETPDSVKLKLIKVMEENHFLRTKVCKLENQAARKEGSGGSSLPQDDLRQKYEQLSLQVESLQQQLDKTNKLQETVNLLHNSQRSLVCTNEYLVQQLNKISPHLISKPPLTSQDRTSADRHLYSEPSAPSAQTSHCTGPYRTFERLSLCPL
ncbi:leucine-rich repeat-containing protein 36-like isoform X2 [Eleutherodactylus coqui]|uniref:leucine-rich repeat-containing protein 36-like isoform X2 n=1 Tax=Eleutherodactylus coqui TaxID=57060 RepID=UPI00346371FB